MARIGGRWREHCGEAGLRKVIFSAQIEAGKGPVEVMEADTESNE